MRRTSTIVFVAILVVVVGAGLAWQMACDEDYDITVRISPTGNPAYPYSATGSVVGFGIRRLEGAHHFMLMLRPGTGPSISRSTLGRSLVNVEAGISPDGRTGWSTAMVTRGGKVIVSERSEVQLR